MADTQYSELFPYVLTEIIGCSSIQADIQIRAAVIEFCRRAKVWSYRDDPMTTSPQVGEYDVDTPSDTSLVEIKGMYINGEPLTPAQGEYDPPASPGVPQKYRQLTPETCTLWPVPDGHYDVTFELTLAPSLASTGFPTWIAERYHSAIVCSAKARLMLMPGNSWSNPQQAAIYASMYETAVAAALANKSKSFARTTLRTTSQH